MNVNYCDLCATPLKPGKFWILYIATPREVSEDLHGKEQVEDYINKVTSEEKEVCPTCYHLFNRIFFHRLEGMAALTEECYDLFNLPPYEKKHINKIELKKKKGKK